MFTYFIDALPSVLAILAAGFLLDRRLTRMEVKVNTLWRIFVKRNDTETGIDS